MKFFAFGKKSILYDGRKRIEEECGLKEKELLEYLIRILLERLNDLYDEAVGFDQFVFGERTAYVECLEIIQEHIDAEKYGLSFNIEGRYPV